MFSNQARESKKKNFQMKSNVKKICMMSYFGFLQTLAWQADISIFKTRMKTSIRRKALRN